jgi:ABC-type polysaccharide/polyol phosphate export permease
MASSTSSIAEVWSFRPLVWNFAQRELKGKYKGSVLGWAWSLINPVATLITYTLVFSTIFRAVPPPLGNGREGNYTLFLFTGLVVWTFFSNTVNGSMSSLVSVGPLLRKIYFPPFAPVAGGAVANGVQTVIEISVLLLVMTVIGNVSLTMLLVPVLCVLLGLFALGIGLVLSVWNVYYRDVSYLVGLALQILFYATPIIYPPSLVPEQAFGLPLRALLLQLNPVAQFVSAFRDVVYELQTPSLVQMLSLTVISLGTLSLGWWIFHRRARDVSEEL